jgi:hypothetical protein
MKKTRSQKSRDSVTLRAGKSLQQSECGQNAEEGGQGQNQKYHAGVLHSHHHPKIYQNAQKAN